MKHFLLGAKYISADMQAEFGKIPPFLLPIGGGIVLDELITNGSDSEFYVVCSEGVELVRDILGNKEKYKDIACLDIEATRNIGETSLKAVIKQEIRSGERITFQFADTIISDPLRGGDSIYYGESSGASRWTAFEIDESDNLEWLIDKGTGIVDPLRVTKVISGKFVIDDGRMFIDFLKKSVEENSGKIEPFYIALFAYLRCRRELVGESYNPYVKVQEWRDVGHRDTYHAARRLGTHGTRVFNNLKLSHFGSRITKTSTHIGRIEVESSWYASLPEELSHYAPRRFDHSDPQKLQLEYYGYPTLSEIFLFGTRDESEWVRICEQIAGFTMVSRSVASENYEIKIDKKDLNDIYVNKTIDRLREVRSSKWYGLRQIKSIDGLEINWDVLESEVQLASSLEKLLSYKIVPAYIHGDLHFGNILYDYRSGTIKLVDPRGKFGEKIGFGDARYDLAKVLHSSLGMYDLILNGQVSSISEDESLYLVVNESLLQGTVRSLVTRWVQKQSKDVGGYSSVHLIMALLFLSMGPLHSDNPDRQKIMLAVGLHEFSIAIRDMK